MDTKQQSIRQRYLDEFQVSASGRIASPGKFEGEMIYVPYFWDCFLEGGADSDNGEVISFKLDSTDKTLWPEIPARKRTMRLYERSDGFVCEC
jgi:hypothetical protein